MDGVTYNKVNQVKNSVDSIYNIITKDTVQSNLTNDISISNPTAAGAYSSGSMSLVDEYADTNEGRNGGGGNKYYLYGSNFFGLTWTPQAGNVGKYIDSISGYMVNYSGTSVGDLYVEIRENGWSGNLAVQMRISAAQFSQWGMRLYFSSYGVNPYNPSRLKIKASTTYYIILRASGGDTSSNYYWINYDGGTPSNGGANVANYYSTNSGSSWNAGCNSGVANPTYLWPMTFYFYNKPLITTITKQFNIGGLVKLSSLSFTKNTPSNTNVTVDLLDQSNNILFSNVSSPVDISSINTRTVTQLKMRVALSRTVDTASIPSFTNWMLSFTANMIPFYKDKILKVASVSTTGGEINAVNVTGSGCLLSVVPPSGNNSGSARIVADGITYSLGGGYYSYPLTLFLEFKSSLQVYGTGVSGYSVSASYYLD